MQKTRGREPVGGLLYGLAAYGWWGLMPLYFRAVDGVRPVEILTHRILWSLLFTAGLVTVVRRWGDLVRVLRSPRTLALLAASATLVAINWLVYIHGVATRQVVQTSLGYFINPLVSVLLGLAFFRERLRPLQWAGVALAVLGVLYLVRTVGEVPWIALGVAGSFGLYGLVRKVAPVDGLIGLSVETILLAPVAGLALAGWWLAGTSAFGQGNARVDGLLLLSGVVTAIPLLCFGQAARALRLSTLGFLQYLTPSLQLFIAVLVFEEPFTPAQRIAFGCAWAALALVSADSALAQRRRSVAVRPACATSYSAGSYR